MANQKIEEYKQRLAEMYRAKSNDKLNTNENVETLLSPNKTVSVPKTTFGGTMAELGDNLLTGFLKGTEGMMDAVATVAGHVGSLFGADTKWAEDFVSADLANGMMNDWLGGIRNKSQESYTNLLPDTFQEGYDGVTTSIGQMLPSIVLGAGGKVLGAGSKAVQAISMGSFGAGAMGTSVEEGLNEGATFGEATGYGVLQGGKEMATEWVGNKVFGSKLFGVFGDTAEIGIKSLAKEAFGEGTEEVISTFFDPLVKKATINKDESWEELYEGFSEDLTMSFITGAITGGIMGGASTGIQVAQYGVDGVNAMNTMQEAHETVEKIVKLEQKKASMDSSKYQEEMDSLYKTLDEQYTKYESQIKELKRKHGTDSKKAQYFTSITEYMDDVATAHQQDLAIRQVIDRYNKTHKNTINYKALKQDKFTQAVKDVRGENYKQGDENSNAFILGDGYIIVNKDSEAYKQGRLYNVIGHEFIHKIEKTEGYKELFNNFVKGFTQEELNAKIQEYGKTKGYGFENGNTYLLEEAFADYIGENVAINYQEFAKMLGADSKWSKIKEKLLGYRGSLTEGLRDIQSKVKNTLKDSQQGNLEMARASKNDNDLFEDYREKQVFEEEVRKRKNRPNSYDEIGKSIIYTANNVFIVDPNNNYKVINKYNSDDYYDMTHEGEEDYGYSQTTDGTIEEKAEQRTSNSSIRSGVSSKEGNGNDRILEREGENIRRDSQKNGGTSKEIAKFSRNATDSNGTKLTEEQIDFFEESQARDENGDLIPLYHGTTWEFYTFDKEKASPEGDMGSGFYFTTNEVDADQNYADGENSGDLKGKIASLAERIEYTDDVDYEEAERRAKELLMGDDAYVMEVYLNIKNPAYPNTAILNYEDFISDYSMDDYEDEYEYYDKIDEEWYEHTQNIMYEVDNILNLSDYDYKQLERLFNEFDYRDYTIEEIKSIVNNNYEFNDDKGNLINNEVVRAIVEASGFDGIIDDEVSKKFKGMGLSQDTTHYIVFKSNQIKLTSNKKPTKSNDVRFSRNKAMEENMDFDEWLETTTTSDDKFIKWLEDIILDEEFTGKVEDDSYYMNEGLSKPYFNTDGEFKKGVITSTSFEQAYKDLIFKPLLESDKYNADKYNFEWFEQFVYDKLDSSNSYTYEAYERIINNYKRKLKDEVFTLRNRDANKKFRSPNFMPKNIKTVADTLNFRASGKTLMYTSERINKMINYNTAQGHPNYSKAFTTFVSPHEFLELTLPNAEEWFMSDVKELDMDKIKNQDYRNYDNMLLEVDMKTGEVKGHEGRHRMYALMKEGFTNVQILLIPRNYDKYNTDKQKYPSKLTAQTFNIDDGKVSSLKVNLTECLPLSEANRAKFETIEKYLPQESDNFVRFSRNNVNWSNEFDSEGNQLSENQVEFFENVHEELRDENGNIKVMFHGTKADFTVFDYSKDGINTGSTIGHWFTDRKSWAETISIRGAGKGESKVMEVYLNITNPVTKGKKEINRHSLVRACALAGFDFDSYMEEYGVENFYSLSEQNYVVENDNLDDYQFLEQLFEDTENKYSQEIIEELKWQGYDGIYYPNKRDTSWIEGNVWVAFDSNQIKATDNYNPTDNQDIRFSKSGKKQIETKAVKEKIEQVEGEIVEPNISTEVRTESEAKSKVKKTQTPLTTDSNLAWKFYSNLMNDKVYNKSNADGFINAIEQDIKNKFGNDAKVDFKGNKEQLGKNLFQDLNNPSNVSKEQAVKHFLEYFSQIEVNGVSIKEALNNIDPVLYDDFIKQMNINLVSLFNSGTQSKMDKVISTYTSRINRLVEALRYERNYAKELLKTVKTLKSTISKHKGKNASVTSLDISQAIPELNSIILKMEDLLSRTDYLKADFRTLMQDVKTAFTKNSYLQRAGYLTEELIAEMDYIINNAETLGRKKINIDEMKILRKICATINKIYNEYDEAVINGERVVASETANKMINEIVVKDQKQMDNITRGNKIKKVTGMNFRTESALMLNTEYEKSEFSKVVKTLEKASNEKKRIKQDLTDKYHKTMKDKRRNLAKKLGKSNFTLSGIKVTDAEIITLYMTWLRGDVATRHLFSEGIRFVTKAGNETKAIKITEEQMEDVRKYVESNYADFIVVLKEIFHEKAGQYYNATLDARTGYTDELEANYFPMRTSKLDFESHIADPSQLVAQYQEFIKPSFTKHLTKNANNSLVIESIDLVVESFTSAMANFAGITPAIQNLNRVFNTQITVNGKETSLMNYIKENHTQDFDKTLNRLLINMQDRRTTGKTNKLASKLRGGIASASLGGNPKVWFLQVASFPIAVSQLGITSSFQGVFSLPLSTDTVTKVSPYFKDRWENDQVKNAMVVSSNIGSKATGALSTIGDFFAKPINWFSKRLDMMVIRTSIARIAKDNKMTIKQVKNSPELLKQAIDLAEQVCRRTQSQFDVLESGSTIYEAGELTKSLYMFSSDARVITNLLMTKFHDAKVTKKVGPFLKTLSGVFMTQLIVALLDVMARAFLDKTEDEDKDGQITDDMLHDFLVGTLENMTVNLIPMVRDFYNKIAHGYDINNVSLDYINDIGDAINTLTTGLGEGNLDSKDFYNFTKIFGTTFGIPVKNLTEYTTATFAKFDAKWAIKAQDILYYNSVSDTKSDILNAYNNNKISRLVAKTESLLSQAGLDTPNTKACTEMARLYSLGFTQIYPSTSIDTFTYEGQQFKLNNSQQAKFSDIYNDATKELELLISSPAYYKLNDTAKAKAIKKVYSLYYSLAKAEFIQDYEYSPTEEALFELDAHDLVLYLTHIDTIKATTALSKKEQVIRYLNRQGLNKKELEAIFNILGYKVNSSNSILGNSMLSNSLFN